MLYLSRRAGEAIIINNDIEVRVVEVKGRSVKLGLTFPADASVLREEVYLQIKQENEAAAKAAGQLGTIDIGPFEVKPDKAKSG
jgi:carbon storage regulator